MTIYILISKTRVKKNPDGIVSLPSSHITRSFLTYHVTLIFKKKII